MSWLAQVARDHPVALPATMRRTYGLPWHAVGQPDVLPWPEALALVRAAMEDPSTCLGAAAAGWTYPAREIDILLLMAVGGDAARDALPFPLDHTPTPHDGDGGDGEDIEQLAAAAAADMQALIRVSDD